MCDGYEGFEYVLWTFVGFWCFGLGVLVSSMNGSAETFVFGVFGSSSSDVVTSISLVGSSWLLLSPASPFCAVYVSGSGSGSIFPVTISHNQSAIPPGTMSTAVCGLYTLIP